MELTVSLIDSCVSVPELCQKVNWPLGSWGYRLKKIPESFLEAIEKLRSRGRSLRGIVPNFFDKSFFFQETPSFEYFLGYFAGDGCICQYKVGQNKFWLGSTDKEFIFSYRSKIKSTHRVINKELRLFLVLFRIFKLFWI